MTDPDAYGPLAVLPWLARLVTGSLAACAVCTRSTVHRIPGAAPGGRDLGLHPPCIAPGVESGVLAEGALDAPVAAPVGRPRGAYARRRFAAA